MVYLDQNLSRDVFFIFFGPKIVFLEHFENFKILRKRQKAKILTFFQNLKISKCSKNPILAPKKNKNTPEESF